MRNSMLYVGVLVLLCLCLLEGVMKATVTDSSAE